MNQPRSWTTPLLTGTFLLVAVTGVLMFFHAPFALVHVAHEWLSWLFLAAAAVHLVLNVRPLGAALRPRLAKVVVAVFAVLTVAAVAIPAQRHGPPERCPPPAAEPPAP